MRSSARQWVSGVMLTAVYPRATASRCVDVACSPPPHHLSPPDPPSPRSHGLTHPARAQIPRKLLHSSIALVVLYLWLSHPNLLTLLRYLAYATTVIATADVLRFRFAWFERAYEGLLGYFMVRRELIGRI